MPEIEPYYFDDKALKQLELIMRASNNAKDILALLEKEGVDTNYYKTIIDNLEPLIDNILYEYIPWDQRDAFFEAIKPAPLPEPVEFVKPEIKPVMA